MHRYWILFGFLLIGCTASNNELETDDQNLPNIVFIISDDQSWTDYSFMGHPHIETPNIDNLASEGLTFTRGYLPAPICRLTLASMLTGLHPHQHGVTGNDPAFEFDRESHSREEWLQAREEHNRVVTDRYNSLPNLNTYLTERGYLSLQTGKWWEGSYEDAGFTHGMTHGDPSRGGRHGDEGLKIGREGLDPIEAFMDEAAEEDRPFFIWYAPFMPHTPHTPPDSLLEKYSSVAPSEPVARYWAMIDWFDFTVGQLLDSIDDRGLTDNTMVVYLADNGWIQNPDEPNRFAWPSKQSPYDMGIRTHMTYKWPGEISSRMDTTTFVSTNDMVPTVLKAVGIEPERELPGVNVLDRQALNDRHAVFSADYHHDIADVQNPTESQEHRMVMKSPWKLILPKQGSEPQIMNSGGGGQFIDMIEGPELYHIVNDPHELENVSAEYPEVVNELEQLIDGWWESTDPPNILFISIDDYNDWVGV
ncbi:MAG: sulfatase-like hydrolase/transferase, partial [Balneolaceae bacterium]